MSKSKDTKELPLVKITIVTILVGAGLIILITSLFGFTDGEATMFVGGLIIGVIGTLVYQNTKRK